ncbi:MAG TPA: plastocyanin/azurin family copper-binding protein [Gemmatimonadaceae bacterium]|jgi:plastocyanin|nr:plastocyanin/azurin family copper-binding protein [Gemmatimonadaceae bacterium]
MIRALARTIAALTIVALLSECGSAVTAPLADSTSVSATSDMQFTPSTMHVSLSGTTPTAIVTWVFQSVVHSVVWDTQPEGADVFDVGNTSNASVSRAFHVAGTYSYHCAIHSSMSGTVIVE